MKMFRICLAIVILGILGLYSCDNHKLHIEPTEITAGGEQIISPNNQFALECISNDSRKMYEIWLINKSPASNIKRQLLFEYERNASVLWSPDSNKILINVHTGSGFIDVYIFKLDKETHFIEDENLEQLVRNKITNPILNAGIIHLYTVGEEWIDKNTFIVHVGPIDGQGGITEVDLKYKVNLETQVITEIK